MLDYKFAKRLCKTCGNEFQPKCEINVFCSRRCFKKNYYHRKKAEEINAQTFPIFICSVCKEEIVLKFDPTKNSFKWIHFVCPKCIICILDVSEDIITYSPNCEKTDYLFTRSPSESRDVTS